MTPQHFWNASPGILSLTCNVKSFPWSWDLVNLPTTRVEWEKSAVKITVEVCKHTELSPSGRWRRPYHNFAWAEDDVVEYCKPLAPKLTLRLSVQGLASDSPKLRVSPAYNRLVKYRFMNLHGPNYVASDIACAALLRQCYSPLHASSFALGPDGIVLAAPPNMGKTLTVLQACREYDVLFLSEDLLITDGVTLYPVPWTSTFRYYRIAPTEQSAFGRLANGLFNSLRARAPALDLVGGAKLPITAYLPDIQIPARAEAKHLVFLERGPNRVESIDASEALRRLWNLNRFEFWYQKSPLFHAYDYFSGGSYLRRTLRTELDILRTLSNAVEQRLVISVQNPMDYVGVVMGHVQ